MNLVVEVVSEEVKTRVGTTKDGRNFTSRTQEAYIHKGDKYPLPFKLQLADDHAGFKPGRYVVSPTSFFVGRFGDLQLRRVLELEREDASGNGREPTTSSRIRSRSSDAT